MSKRRFLIVLFGVTAANFAAQIPYYLHQYYVPSRTPPSIIGVGLMTGVLIWFLAGMYGLTIGKKLGFVLMASFLAVEFLFYLQTQISQYLTGHGVLLYVLHPSNATLFVVFGIGYLNFVASAWFMYHLWKYRSQFIKAKSQGV